jgi:AraC-like DNA-binding protein
MELSIRSLYDDRLLAGDCHPVIEAWYYRVWDGFDMTPHRHDRCEIMYVVTGECTVHIGADLLRMQAGSLILVDAGVAHSLHVPAGAPCRMMNLEFGFAPGAALLSASSAAFAIPSLRAFLSPPRAYRLLSDAEDLHMRIRTLLDVLDAPDTALGATASSAELELHFLGLLVSMARRSAEGSGGGGTALVPVHVRRSLLFLRENYDREIGLAETAAAVGVSAGHLARVFRASMGESVGATLSRIRLDRAQQLLADSDHPIGTIAGMVGFDSRHYFNAFFRERCGMTPKAYRDEARHRFKNPDGVEGDPWT